MLTLLQQHRRGGGGGGAGGGVGKVAGVVSEDSVHSGNQSTSAHSQPTGKLRLAQCDVCCEPLVHTQHAGTCNTCAQTCICMHTHAHICIHMYMHTHMHTCTHIMYMHTHVRAHTHAYMCIYTIYVYTHSSFTLSLAAHPQPHLRRTSLLQGTTHTPSSTTSLTKPPHKTAETKDQWAAIKLAIGDSQNFRDLITALHWEDGLTIEAVNLITSRLNVESRSEKSQRWSSTPPSAPAQQHAKVTFTAAKHAAEIVGMIFGFAVGMVEYTSVYQTHQLATDKLRR